MDTIEKVIGLEKLEEATLAGWEVVARFETDEAVPTSRMHVYEGQPNYYGPGKEVLYESAVGRVAKFHVRFDSASTLARLNDELLALKNALCSAKRNLEVSDKKTESLKKEGERLELELQRGVEDAKRLREKVRQTEDSKSRLEADLGKIRETIGRKAFQEILDGSI